MGSGKVLKSENVDVKLRASARTYEAMLKMRELIYLEAIEGAKAAEAQLSNKVFKTHDLTGLDYSSITTTLGNLKAKRTSNNPNFSAVIVDMLSGLDLKKGDTVALNLSGSFPVLNFAAIVAVEEMGLKPVIISSIGSSTYGANRPDLTYQDMESALYGGGYIFNKSLLVSPGGDGDMGLNMDGGTLEMIRSRLAESGYIYYLEANLQKNIENRMEIYQGAKLLINVGGNIVSQSDSDLGYFWDYGLIQPETKLNYQNRGLIGRFLSAGKPVIQMLNILDIAKLYNMPIDMDLVPDPGHGDVYEATYYSKLQVYMMLMLITMVVGIYGIQKTKKVDKELFKNIPAGDMARGSASTHRTYHTSTGQCTEPSNL